MGHRAAKKKRKELNETGSGTDEKTFREIGEYFFSKKFGKDEPITDDLIQELTGWGGLTESDLRVLQKKGHRYNRARNSFMSDGDTVFGFDDD